MIPPSNEKLTNVALKKKTFQTSTYGGRRRKYYSSAKAVDGLSKTFSMTNKVRRVDVNVSYHIYPSKIDIPVRVNTSDFICH
jgi:DNA-binding transcriptional regulator GbsR (MarR family)